MEKVKGGSQEWDRKLEDLFDRNKAAEGAETMFSSQEREAILTALYNCKILDPACGSGAFPMGILHCMVRLLTRLDPQSVSIREHLLARYKEDKALVDPTETADERKERLEELESRLKEGQHYPDYERKLYLIENCIYGVDIQPIATQISKLRFFISLLCDQLRSSYDPDAENFGLLSLPNLEAKFVCANTLISLPDLKQELPWEDIAELRNSLQTNRHKIFRARSTKTKEKYKAKDLEIRDAIRATVRDSLAKPDEDVIAKCREQIADAKKRREAVAEPDWYEEDVQVQADLFAAFEKKRVRKDRNEPSRKQIDAEIDWAEKKIKDELKKADKSNVSAATRYADMVAGWDPYDQNASSDFFDPVWMFNNSVGFDIVIGNPPYGAKVSQIEAKYYQSKYPVAKTITGKQKGSTDTFAVFINRGFDLLSKNSGLIYIVPMSVTSSEAMSGVHKLIFDNCREVKVSSYSNRPRQIFESAGLRCSIIQFQRTDSPVEHLWTSKMMRRNFEDEISSVIASLSFVDSVSLRLPGRIPRIGTAMEVAILKKLFSCSPLRKYMERPDGNLYYRSSGGRYWNVITNYPTGSTKEKAVELKYSKLCCACLSSSLFWLYQQIYTNGLDLKSYEVESFPLPCFDELAVEQRRFLQALYDKYTKDIEKHANRRTTSEGSSYAVSDFKEYKIGYSKKIIDEIDDFIGPLYGLTKDEVEFIKNYEIEYRMADYLTPEELERLRTGRGESGAAGVRALPDDGRAGRGALSGDGVVKVRRRGVRVPAAIEPVREADDEELE